MRINTDLKKNNSACYISTTSKIQIKMNHTINYNIKEEEMKVKKKPKIMKEKNHQRKNCIKLLKKKYFLGNLILPKPFQFKSLKNNKNNNSEIEENKNTFKMHKNTFSGKQSFGSFFNYNSHNNSNTTANTNSNKTIRSNTSYQKYNNNYKINLKKLLKKDNLKQNLAIKNICPIKHINHKKNNIILIGEYKNENIDAKEEINNISLNSNNYKEEDNLKRYNNIKYSNEYINDIYDNLLKEERELKIYINPNYFSFQTEINDKMRAILIDWLIDVQTKFNFKEETLYITIYIIDCYLSLKRIERRNLQLLGVAALFIACKQNEILFLRLKEYAYITDNAYNESDIINMENIILKTLNFNILFPSSLSFYEIISNNIEIINDLEKFNLGKFLIQCFYVNSNCLKYSFSTIACAATYIVMKFFKMKNYQFCYDGKLFNIKKNIEMKEYQKQNNSFPIHIIKECAKDICYFIGELSKNNLKAVIRKFSNETYGNVSRLIFGSSLSNKKDE